MARQDGLIQLTGSVGNLSFYKTQDGYLVRKKGAISGDRVKSDPAFARTRENATEFARAGRAGKLLRTAFRPLLQSHSDNRVTSRLAGAMVKVIKADAINSRGERNVVDGNTALLEGFEFNQNASLKTTFAPPIGAAIDRPTGNMVVSVPAFSPAEMISAPDGATHFRLKASGAAIDFEGNIWSVAIAESADLSLGNKMLEPLQLSLTIASASEHPLFLIFGIEFLQLTKSGSRHPLNNGAFNAMAIAKVDDPATSDLLPDEKKE